MELRQYITLLILCTVCTYSQDVVSLRENPAIRAFLDVIACLEGTYNAGYNVKFGGKRFSGYADHPREEITYTVRGKEHRSTAAGRYQLDAQTWDAVCEAISAPSFSPRYQDYAMIYICDMAEALPYIKALDLRKAFRQLEPYKQSIAAFLSGGFRRYSQDSLYATFIARYRHYSKDNSVADVLEAYLTKPEVRAFLDMISFAEGTNTSDGYRMCFTGKRCNMNWHPEKAICAQSGNRRICSSAAGRYQFLKDAWNIVAWRIAAQDFSAHEQDRAAIQVMLDIGAIHALLQGDLQKAVQRANGKWASLPGARYKQPTKTFNEVAHVFYKRRSFYGKK